MIVAFWVFVYVQVGVSPAVMTARTVVSPGSKPAVAALGEGAADAGADGDHGAVGGADDVRERPAGLGRLLDVLGAELEAGEGEGALAVGLATAVSRVKGREARAVTGEVEGRGAAQLCFSMSSEAFWVFVYVQVTASPGTGRCWRGRWPGWSCPSSRRGS